MPNFHLHWPQQTRRRIYMSHHEMDLRQ